MAAFDSRAARTIPQVAVQSYQPKGFFGYPSPSQTAYVPPLPGAAASPAPPPKDAHVFVHVHVRADSAERTSFPLEFTPALETVAFSPVYLLEFCIQGVPTENPAFFVNVSTVRAAMRVPAYAYGSGQGLETNGGNRFVVTCNDIPNFRASRSFTYPARYLGTWTQTNARNMEVSVERFDHNTGNFRSPWLSDEDLLTMDYAAGTTVFDRTLDMTLMIVGGTQGAPAS